MRKSQFLNNMVKPLFYGALLIVAGTSTVWACGHPPPMETVDPGDPPPEVWMKNHGVDPETGKQNMWVGVEIDPVLFDITDPTICTCAIGLPAGLPPSVVVTDAKLAVTNIETHEIVEVLAEFDFERDDRISQEAASNAILPEQEWTGFSGLVESVTQPEYGPDEVLKLWFNIESDPDTPLPFGEYGFSIGGDPDSIDHAPLQFVGVKVSEPESLSLALLGAGTLLLLRSRRKQTA